MNNDVLKNNVERFIGFGKLYDQNRPSPPSDVVNILSSYCSKQPQKVVDVGCGTGLSSFLWLNNAKEIVGVEPNDDMRKIALSNWQTHNKPDSLRFIKGFSHQLEMEAESVDIITCSQSFHWMDPQPTLKEFARVLRPGGVFAAYDCDWPPSFNWKLEESYKRLNTFAENQANQLSATSDHAYKWKKEEHLQQIKVSGLFRFSKEVVFHHWETFDSTRFINLALSQGGLQTALKLGVKDLEQAIATFRDEVQRAFDDGSQEILFSYRMRLGIK